MRAVAFPYREPLGCSAETTRMTHMRHGRTPKEHQVLLATRGSE